MFRFLALSLAALAIAPPALAAPGDLDPSFGTNGVASFRIGSSWESIQGVGRQADGKLIAVGVGAGGMLLARYHPDGALDTTFGSGGVARHLPYGLLKGMVVQDDGKIIVLAECTGGGGEFIDACLHRFEANGARDPAFETRAFGRDFSVASALVRQPDGKTLLAARTPRGFGAVRLLPSGAFDPAFGEGGVASLTVPNLQAVPGTLVLQADGKVVVFGVGAGVAVARFHADGQQDAGFTASIGALMPRASVQQPDSKIVVAGCRTDPNNGPSRLLILRLLADGTPDSGFGSGGAAEPVPALAGCPHALLLRPNGALVTDVDPGGWPGARFRVVQLQPNGTPDANFGSGGLAEFSAGGDADRAFAMMMQPDGKVVVTGDRWGRDFALARLLVDGHLDASFGSGGIVNTDLHDGRWGVLKAARLAGGATYVLSHLYEHPSGPLEGDVGVTRLLANGAPDLSFGQGGHAVAAMSSQRGDLSAGGAQVLAVLADGRVVIGGNTGWQAQRGAVLRLSASGEHDASFAAAARDSFGDRMATIHAIEAMPDGRVVIAGIRYATAPPFESNKGTVLRLLPDGGLDPSFNIVEFDVYRSNYSPSRLRLTLQVDGKVVVSNFAKDALSAMRLSDNGLLDSTFGAGGRAIVPLGTPYPLGLVLAAGHSQATTLVHSDGRMTLTATSTPSGTCPHFSAPAFHAAFARLRPSGALAGGPRLTSMGGKFPYLETARLDAHERIVASGTYMAGCGITSMLGQPLDARVNAPGIFRFTPSGAPDPQFGSGGMVALGSAPAHAKVVDTALQADGKIIAIVDAQGRDGFEVYRLDNGDSLVPEGPPGDADGDSIPDVVETAESRDPAWRDNDVFSSARLFAMQQYRDFLGREGDAGGVAHWTTQLGSAQTRAQMAETFFNSAEFQGLAAPVVRLYFAYFLRTPDYDGLNFWIGQLRGASPLETISNAFAGSVEFANRYGALTNPQFVSLVYQNVLGRAPDAPGLAFWTGQLGGGMTRGRMMLEFSESAEYRGLITNEVFVTMMYAGMLRRAPDAGGFSHWVNYLDARNSGLALTQGFIDALEYRNRFLP